MLASREDMNAAMLLQGDDALTLVDILDQVSGGSRVSSGTNYLATTYDIYRLSMTETYTSENKTSV